ncbi:hypothetical protein Q2941_33540 [Bradyrhizobium sp. UFLA05-153]
MTEDEAHAIVLAVANRTPISKIAETYGITEAEVHATVDQRAADMFDGVNLRRKMFLEDARLAALGVPHYEKGLAGDVASAAIYVKISERRATMTGMNAPQGHVMQLIHQSAPVKQLNSTQEIRAAIDQVCGITSRERELLDRREIDGDKDPAILEEVNQLRIARGKRPTAADDPD